MQPNLYFIAAMPRSRTAWLSNLLTSGPSVCVHDAAVDGADVESLTRMMQSIESVYVGLADTGICFYWKQLFERHPDVPVVVIERDYESILQSWIRYTEPYPALWGTEAQLKLKHSYGLFQEMKKNLKGRNFMSANFEDLNNINVCQDIWEFCVPQSVFDVRRCVALQKLNVQAKFDDYVRTSRFHDRFQNLKERI